MIILQKGNASENIYFTAQENSAVSLEWYWIEFTNRITQDVVIKKGKDDSTTARYQKLVVNTELLFDGYDEGFWSYNIWQWDEEEDEKIGDILESGFMYLYPATEFAPTKYNEQSNSFVTYNG